MQILYRRLSPSKIFNPVPIITSNALATIRICSTVQLTTEKPSSREQFHKAEAAALVPPALPLQFFEVVSLNFK